VANESGNVRPEPPLVRLRKAAAGDGDGLARESGADEVGSGQLIGVQLLDVAPAGHARPVFGEHPLAVRVDLDLPNARPASAFEAKIQAADAGEQAEEGRAGHRGPALAWSHLPTPTASSSDPAR